MMLKKSFTLTNQRAIILEYLKENYSHPSVDEIFTFVKQRLPRISKKTVYTSLQFLRDKGLISEVKVKGVQRYEPTTAPHHHAICRTCGKMMDIASDDLLSHAMAVGKTINDFRIEYSHVTFYGICRTCMEEDKHGN